MVCSKRASSHKRIAQFITEIHTYFLSLLLYADTEVVDDTLYH